MEQLAGMVNPIVGRHGDPNMFKLPIQDSRLHGWLDVADGDLKIFWAHLIANRPLRGFSVILLLTLVTAKMGGIPGVVPRRVWRRWTRSGYPIVRVLLVV